MKILIVEDSLPLQKRLMESFLAVDSLTEIYQAFSSEESIEFFSSYQPEIVILDLELPGESGIILLRKFKENKPGVEVIIFTGHSISEYKKSCLDLNAIDFIDKSDFSSIIETVYFIKKQTYEQTEIKSN